MSGLRTGLGLVIVGGIVWFGACGRGKSHSKNTDNPASGGSPTSSGGGSTTPKTEGSTSVLMATKAELPTCNADRAGNLAYVTDEAKFYTCQDESTGWVTVDIQTSGQTAGAASVYDGGDVKLGALLSTEPPAGYSGYQGLMPGVSHNYYSHEWIAIAFANGGTGWVDAITGKYAGGFTGIGPGSCLYSSSDCTGQCYLEAKPMKHSIFQANATTFYQGTGSETDHGNMSIQSGWSDDFGGCVATGYSISSSYPLGSQSYSFPSGTSYPFTGGLYFGE